MTQPTVALLGTGTMGAGMARNIAAARIPLTVWNRTRSRAEPLAEAGIEVADSPADAVRDADLVVTMLFDVESVESALDEARDGLKQGAVLVQQSTVGVAGADALAARAAALGLVYVDAPVLGTKKPAEEGALVILASGPDEVRDTVAPLFDAIGSRTVWVGDAGQGTRLKLVANSWVLTVVEGIAESLTLAKALGIEPRQFLDVEQHRDHEVGVTHGVGRGVGHLDAGRGEGLGLAAGAVPDCKGDAGSGDVARHAGAHGAGAQEGHGRLVGHASTS